MMRSCVTTGGELMPPPYVFLWIGVWPISGRYAIGYKFLIREIRRANEL